MVAFSYFPSKNSDAWQKAQEEDKFDDDTLKGIYRKESPFYGNFYPFRFLFPDQYELQLSKANFSVRYKETVSRPIDWKNILSLL